MTKPRFMIDGGDSGVQIIVDAVQEAGFPPAASLGLLIPSRPSDFSLDELRVAAVEIGRGPLTETGHPSNSFTIDLKDEEIEWGASGWATTVIVAIGTGIIQELVRSQVIGLGQRWSQRDRSQSPDRALEDWQAEEYVRWYADATYPNSTPFAVARVSRDPSTGRVEFTLVGADPTPEVSATVELVHGLPLVMVTRETGFPLDFPLP